MATYQVRIDADGEKVLSEPLAGLEGGIATEEAPGVVRPDGTTTRVDNTGVLSAIGGNLLLNEEEWITESGEWEAPVTGWYDVWIINGGGGGAVSIINKQSRAGESGAFGWHVIYLMSGQEIQVTIGAGGLSTIDTNGTLTPGGQTTFGSLTAYSNSQTLGYIIPADQNGYGSTSGAGSGGGRMDMLGIDGTQGAGRWYGGGGASRVTPSGYDAGNGAQGAVYLRWHDPAKAAGPTE